VSAPRIPAGAGVAPHAVVLAAGIGSRLHALNSPRHKSLSDVGGRPILGRTLDNLVSAGVHDVTVVVGHLGAQVQAFTQSWASRLRLQYAWNRRVAATGTAYSLAQGMATAGSDRDILIIEADVVFDETALMRLLDADARDATLVAPFASHIHGSAVVCDDMRRIRDWLHASHQGPNFPRWTAYKTVNLTLLSARTTRSLEAAIGTVVAEREDAPLEYAMRLLVGADDVQVLAVDVDSATWYEVDTAADLAHARWLFRLDAQPAGT
jgi:choline kinase